MTTESDSGAFRPSQPRSAQDFVAELRRLRAQAGLPSFRDLSKVAERRAAASADGGRAESLPPSTTSEILAGKRLPRMPRLEFVESYVAACLAIGNADEPQIETEVALWREVWRSLAEREEPERPTAVEVPAQPEAVRPYRRSWVTWATLVATFVAGIGIGAAGTGLWVTRHPVAKSAIAGGAGVDAPAAQTCLAPSGAPSPPGRDVLAVATSPPAKAGTPTPAGTWWSKDVNGVEVQSDGRAFGAAVRGGTAKPGDLIILTNGLSLQQGRRYALAFTASVNRPTTVLVRVQDGSPPLYQSSFSEDMTLSTAKCAYIRRFTASKTSDRSEFTFQVGGHAHDFRLLVSDVVLVEQDA